MNYALLDWDNTIRNGFTLFSLIDYLVNVHFIEESVRNIINSYKDKYSKGIITHDQLAILACDSFSASLKGKATDLYDFHLQNFYSKVDRHCIYSFARGIFKFFEINKIIPIIVSGAPIDAIQKYMYDFSIKEIYAFEYGRVNNLFTGETICNHGYNKKEKVTQIISKYGCLPIYAFGDSSSDYEMMSMSKNSVLISHEKNAINFVADVIVSPKTSEEEIIKILSNCLLDD